MSAVRAENKMDNSKILDHPKLSKITTTKGNVYGLNHQTYTQIVDLAYTKVSKNQGNAFIIARAIFATIVAIDASVSFEAILGIVEDAVVDYCTALNRTPVQTQVHQFMSTLDRATRNAFEIAEDINVEATTRLEAKD